MRFRKIINVIMISVLSISCWEIGKKQLLYLDSQTKYKKVIEENTHLKLILFMGTGYQKYIDVETAKKYNIPVSYTPSANAKAVAE